MILIAGGAADPNLDALARCAAGRGLEVREARTGALANPALD